MLSELKVFPVPATDLIVRWKDIEPILQRAMPVLLGRYEPIDVLLMCMTTPQAFQAWYVADGDTLVAVFVTQIVQHPRKRVLAMFALAGTRMKDWFELAYRALLDFCHRTGCVEFEVQGRKGWERILDIEPVATFLVKKISPADFTQQQVVSNGVAADMSEASVH